MSYQTQDLHHPSEYEEPIKIKSNKNDCDDIPVLYNASYGISQIHAIQIEKEVKILKTSIKNECNDIPIYEIPQVYETQAEKEDLYIQVNLK